MANRTHTPHVGYFVSGQNKDASVDVVFDMIFQMIAEQNAFATETGDLK